MSAIEEPDAVAAGLGVSRDGIAAVGIILAAGAGTRMGRPKATVVADGVAWLPRAVALLANAGCNPVLPVLGADAREAPRLLGAGALGGGKTSVIPVVATDWAEGQSRSLAAGLEAAADTSADLAVITLVDLPGLPASVVERLLAGVAVADAIDEFGPTDTLRQAVFDGRPGHPVLIGRAHWAPLIDELRSIPAGSPDADRGARAYLAAHGAVAVECADLFHGRDRDTL